LLQGGDLELQVLLGQKVLAVDQQSKYQAIWNLATPDIEGFFQY
jgi:hypothetical protein